MLMILPFLILVYFNHPTPEDFYYEEMVKSLGFYDAQRFFFKYWGGRFSYYALVSTNPLIVNSISGYNFEVLFLLVLFFISIYAFTSVFTSKYLKRGERLIFSSSIIFLYLYSMPSVGQGLYWLGSAINYNLAIVFILLFYMIYYRLSDTTNNKYRSIYLAICLLLSVLIAGFNEISALIFLMSVIFLLLKYRLIDKRFDLFLTIVLILNIVSIYIAFTAPGNSGRSGHYAGNHDFVNSFFNSFMFLFRQIFLWLFNSPLIPVTLLLIPFFMKIVKSENPKPNVFSINPVYPILITGLFIFTGIFIMMWSSGILPYGRILNSIFFVFLLGWFYNAVCLCYYFRERLKMYSFRNAKYVTLLSIIVIALVLFRDNNIKTAYTEIFDGSAMRFKNELNVRYDKLSLDACDSCIVKDQVTAPNSFFLMDIDEDPNSVYNTGYARYFKKSSVILNKQ